MSVTSSQATPSPPLTISAAGMCTSMGGLVAGCAAARGGIQRISELANLQAEPDVEELDSPETDEDRALFGHRVRELPEETTDSDRMALLATRALEDLFSSLTDPAQELGRYAFILCLPSEYIPWANAAMKGPAPNAFSTGAFVDPNEAPNLEEIRRSLLSKIFSSFPELPQPVWTGLVREDQAGFSEGMARAAALLAQGRVDTCLLGGVESRIGRENLGALQELGLLMTPDFPAGFIPGEGAAFLLLRPSGWPGSSLATVESAAQAAEPDHRFSGSPPVGEALTLAVRSALQNAGADDSQILALAPVNGSPWISAEWGYLLTRIPALGKADYWFPAGSFGEMGAANGSVAACTVIRGFSRGYINHDQAIVVLSSECGRKGAVVMRRPTSLEGRT